MMTGRCGDGTMGLDAFVYEYWAIPAQKDCSSNLSYFPNDPITFSSLKASG